MIIKDASGKVWQVTNGVAVPPVKVTAQRPATPQNWDRFKPKASTSALQHLAASKLFLWSFCIALFVITGAWVDVK